MRKILLCSLALLIVLPACFDEDPTKPADKDDDNDSSPYSGSFTIADTLDYSTCAAPTVGPTPVTVVTVRDTTILFGTFAGEWDSLTLTGSGTAPEVTVPVPPYCNAYYTVSFSITYTDLDHFYGTFDVSFRKEPECPNPDPCSYRYRIGGTRN